jgi:hypothetical protein
MQPEPVLAAAPYAQLMSLGLLARRTQGNTKADVAAADRRTVIDAERRPAIPGVVAPTAATPNAGPARCRPSGVGE